MVFTAELKLVPFDNQLCVVAPVEVFVKLIVPFKQIAVAEAVKLELTVQAPLEAHKTDLTESVFRVAVAGVIAPPPVELFPAVLVIVDGLVVVKAEPVISLQPTFPFASDLAKNTSLLPAPKLTVYPQKTNEVPIGLT